MLSLRHLSKCFGNDHPALSDFSLQIGIGEIVGVVGGSGCGKSTLLRLVAGLEAPTEGEVRLAGEVVTGPRAEIGMVFQEPRLMPWLRVAENVGFGIHDLPAAERERRITQALARVGLGDWARAWPRQLSGGMAQRAALARALVANPKVMLLDEPFSALDALIRADLQDHLLDLWCEDRPTLLLVTHDIEEALLLSDRIVVMRVRPGRIHSITTPPLPRPRDRLDARFQEWKLRLVAELHDAFRPPLTGEEAEPAAAI